MVTYQAAESRTRDAENLAGATLVPASGIENPLHMLALDLG